MRMRVRTMSKTIKYKSGNGYVGYMYGKSHLRVMDAFDNDVINITDRNCNTYAELKELVENIPDFIDKVVPNCDPRNG